MDAPISNLLIGKILLIVLLLSLPVSLVAIEIEDSTIGRSSLPEMPDDLSSDQKLKRALEEQLGVEFTANNTVVLLPTGRQKFEDMFAAIRQARHYVHLEYFNFRNDSIGKALFTLLAEKVKEGVKVRAMFDSFGNSSNDSPLRNKHVKSIREMGIDIEEFDPIKFPWINHAFHRDHRKIVVIDGLVCYAGGMNVADYYINGRPEYGEWRDMHMQLTGDVVGQYEKIFAQMWWNQTGEIILDDAPSSTPIRNILSDLTPTAGTKVIGVVDRRPLATPKSMRKAYVSAIDAAKEHIQIVNPYPVNVKSVRRAMRRALKRGVRMEIMVSAKSDVPITPDVVGLEMKKMAKRGAEVYYNQTGFHHSKVMMIDGRFCTVGSTNLDARSFLFDYEVNSFILDVPTTRQLQDIFEDDKKDCTVFKAEDYRRQFNLGHRITARFFSLFRGFF